MRPSHDLLADFHSDNGSSASLHVALVSHRLRSPVSASLEQAERAAEKWTTLSSKKQNGAYFMFVAGRYLRPRYTLPHLFARLIYFIVFCALVPTVYASDRFYGEIMETSEPEKKRKK